MDALNPVVLSLYRAAYEIPLAEFQEAALRLMKPLVRFDGCKWGSSTVDERGVLFQSVHYHDDDPGAAEVYNEIRHEDRAAFWALRHRGTTGNFHFPSYFDRHSGMANYTAHYRYSNALVTGLPNSSDEHLVKSVSLYRADPADTFTEQDRLATERLIPHLDEALTVARLLAATRRRADAGRQWSIAICDSAGLLVYVDPQFEALLQAEWPSGFIRRLPDAVQAAIFRHDANAQYTGRTLTMRCERDAGLLFLKARLRVPADGLSRRELAVVQIVAKGYTHKEVARLLQLSPATVRNHIQTIHQRLGVATNAELVAIMMRAGY